MKNAQWQTLLIQFLRERNSMPFAWGPNDCVSFAAAWVALVTGRPITMPSYDGPLEAMKTLSALGGLQAVTCRVLGPTVELVQAGRGDIALCDFGSGPSLGVIVDDRIAGPAPDGVRFAPRSSMIAAWRI